MLAWWVTRLEWRLNRYFIDPLFTWSWSFHWKYLELKQDPLPKVNIESVRTIGVVSGKCETLWEGETSIFLCKPKTFWLFKFWDKHETFRFKDVSRRHLKKQTNKSGLQDFLSLAKKWDSFVKKSRQQDTHTCQKLRLSHEIWQKFCKTHGFWGNICHS